MAHDPIKPTFPALDDCLEKSERLLKSARSSRNKGLLTDADVERCRQVRDLLLAMAKEIGSRETHPGKHP